MLKSSKIPDVRIQEINQAAVNPDGKFVLYWMISARRTKWNFGLERAVEWAKELKRPLVVFEALRAQYRWNSDRIHAFVIQGMANNARDLAKRRVTYYPYLEKKKDEASGLIKKLESESCLIVTDDFPCFFLPKMVKAVGRRSRVRVEAIDSNGLWPMRATDHLFKRAYDFRRFLQKNLLPHLADTPLEDPIKGLRIPELEGMPAAAKKWKPADPEAMAKDESTIVKELKKFDIDHSVPLGKLTGGSRAANARLEDFLKRKLKLYSESRNQPEQDVASGLSPYLHFGHISAHQIFDEVTRLAKWTPNKVAEKATGSSSGWWGASEYVESFLDELITWREVGYNRCALTRDFDKFESLPNWALKTIEEHAKDPREHIYSDEEFEFGRTHDHLWNAAQWQLVSTGVMHNYLRMLWGKKIYQWSSTAQEALATMIHLNNKYALDGRNPNSYSGIFWVLGRYDRAWGPERPVFGKLRYMTSENTARKVKVKKYVRQFAPPDSPLAVEQKDLF